MLDAADVRAALSIREAIPLMADVMRSFSVGEVVQPLRSIVRSPSAPGLLGTMPAVLPYPDGPGFGVKSMVLKPDNPGRGMPLHLGVVLVFDPVDGRPLALMDAGALTAIRTPAVTAVATRTLARADSGDLAILGAGVQARAHLEALALVRPLRRVRVWTRTRLHGERFLAWAMETFPFPVELVDTPSDATRGADIVCSTLATREPVVRRLDLMPGAHVNAVGASFADHREYSSDAVAACTVVVDSYESARSESGDLLSAQAEGAISADHVVAELGEVLLGSRPGRTRSDEITMFKSLGLAVQDVAAGFAVARNARERGLGTVVTWGSHAH